MKFLTVTAATTLTLISLTGCTPAPANVQVYSCIHYATEPTEYTPYCADLGQNFTKISWSSWSETSAVGSATVETNLCDPTCSAGKYDTTTATITLDKPIKTFGKQVYSRLTVKYDKVPVGHKQNEVVPIITENPYNG